MPSPTITAWSSLLTEVSVNTFAGRSLRLGIILEGNQQSDSDIAANALGIISGFEYNSGAWTRPTVTLSSNTLGSYNSTTQRYEINGEVNKIPVTAPAGGFSIRQVFFILGGIATPRDTTGTIVGVPTFAAAIVMAAGDIQEFKLPWTVRGKI